MGGLVRLGDLRLCLLALPLCSGGLERLILLRKRLHPVRQERDQFRADTENLRRELSSAHEQTVRAQQLDAQVKELGKQLEESKQREEQLRNQVAKVEPDTETGSLQKIKSAAAAANSEPERATAMLTLAMQLHDQYVDKGKATAKEITEQSQRKYAETIEKAWSRS